MANVQKAIVLGGTIPHIELIKNLKQRGYHVILVDYSQDPIARPFADEHIIESSMDKDKVLEIAKEENAGLVITTCSDQANVTACFVSEKLGLPAPYSYATSLNVTDKERMKTIMLNNKIPTSKYIIFEGTQLEDKIDGFSFPMIVKPSDSYGSKGVRVVNTKKELIPNLENAIYISRNGRALLEEYKVGTEVGIDCFVKNKKAEIILTKHRQKVVNNEDLTQQIFGCIWPADISKMQLDTIQVIANKIVSAFDLDNTPLMIQAIINDKEISVIEFGARIGGGNSYSIIKLSTGLDIVDAAVDSFLNRNMEIKYHAPTEYYADVFLYIKPSIFGHIEIADKLVDSYVCYKTKGFSVGSDLISSNRVGSLIVKASNKNELLEKLDLAIKNIEVYDLLGNPVFRRELYNF